MAGGNIARQIVWLVHNFKEHGHFWPAGRSRKSEGLSIECLLSTKRKSPPGRNPKPDVYSKCRVMSGATISALSDARLWSPP
jgi:hypothetical protein